MHAHPSGKNPFYHWGGRNRNITAPECNITAPALLTGGWVGEATTWAGRDRHTDGAPLATGTDCFMADNSSGREDPMTASQYKIRLLLGITQIFQIMNSVSKVLLGVQSYAWDCHLQE